MDNYGIKYVITVALKEDDTLTEYIIAISKKDYTGDFESLRASYDSMAIYRDFTDLDQRVLGMRFELDVMNVFTDWFTLFDLMKAHESEYLIEVDYYVLKIKEARVFAGFMNVEAMEQGYVRYQKLHITASSYLSKLSNYTPEIINVPGQYALINILSSVLKPIATTELIRVSASLIPVEDAGIQSVVPGNPGYTFLNKTAVASELFWSNTTESDDSLVVLEKILRSFNLYIFWWDNIWYIVHYNNIWTDATSKYYVEYDINTTYGVNVNGVWSDAVPNEILDLHDLVFTNTTQKIKTDPGYGEVLVLTDAKEYSSLTPPIFDPMTITNVVDDDLGGVLRRWSRFENDYVSWNSVDEPSGVIENGINQNVVQPDFQQQSDYKRMGLACNFYMTITPVTLLTLSVAANITYVKQDYLYRLNYTIMFLDVDGAPAFVSKFAHPAVENEYIYILDRTPLFGGELKKVIQGSQYDRYTASYEDEVPLGQLGVGSEYLPNPGIELPEDIDTYVVQIVIGPIAIYDSKGNLKGISDNTTFGDIAVASEGNDIAVDSVGGKADTGFLNTKELTVDLIDAEDTRYVGTIFRGYNNTEFDLLTSLWKSSATATESLNIMEQMLENAFRFYAYTRETITGNIRSVAAFKPFSLFTDSKQAGMKFVLMGFEHRFSIQAYDLILLEYDNSTDVSIIIDETEGGLRDGEYPDRVRDNTSRTPATTTASKTTSYGRRR